MKKNKCNTRREGFTLVELLIVIVVIGILSAMMMLSSTEAVSSAKASSIISNLRNLKTAALAWYVDSMDLLQNLDWKTDENNNTSKYMEYVKKYLSNGTASGLDDYGIVSSDSRWYIYFDGSKTDANVRAKLKARAASVGLLKGDKNNYTDQYDGGEQSQVAILVR